jgi:hypothetical protein
MRPAGGVGWGGVGCSVCVCVCVCVEGGTGTSCRTTTHVVTDSATHLRRCHQKHACLKMAAYKHSTDKEDDTNDNQRNLLQVPTTLHTSFTATSPPQNLIIFPHRLLRTTHITSSPSLCPPLPHYVCHSTVIG